MRGLLALTNGCDERNRFSYRSGIRTEEGNNTPRNCIWVGEEIKNMHANVVPAEPAKHFWTHAQRLPKAQRLHDCIGLNRSAPTAV